MKLAAITTVIALGLGSATYAQEQLFRSLNVEPGTLTVTQLVQLQSAMEDNDRTQIKFILQDSGAIMSTQSVAMPGMNGRSQLAAHLHVAEDAYTLTELVHMYLDD